MQAAVLFDVRQANLGYQRRTVLQAVNLQVKAGEKIALIGESGAGKSTLLRHLRSLQPQAVAWCPQHSGLVPMLSAFHNIYMGALDRHSLLYNLLNLALPQARPRAEILQVAAEVGMEDFLFTAVERLSGGQQSRINLARALYQRRPVFIGDEPVAALDEVQADQLLQWVCARHETLIVALHDVELALRHCQRIIGLRGGVVELDQPASACSAADLCRLYASG